MKGEPMKLTLYGVKVDAHEYEQIRHLARILLGCTSAATGAQKARRQCVLLAIEAKRKAEAL